jgi:hypothetical protein
MPRLQKTRQNATTLEGVDEWREYNKLKIVSCFGSIYAMY